MTRIGLKVTQLSFFDGRGFAAGVVHEKGRFCGQDGVGARAVHEKGCPSLFHNLTRDIFIKSQVGSGLQLDVFEVAGFHSVVHIVFAVFDIDNNYCMICLSCL